ncbi:MAG: four helix bundle protein [Opitutales bacterium]|nr:four helix bundle protein [Opitutales bacterium]
MDSIATVSVKQPAKSFQDLEVWKAAHEWVLDIYRLTDSFPNSETYGLTSQLRRAAISVLANIAEGFKKRGRADKARFYNIAQGSLEESTYYLILATDLNYITEPHGANKQIQTISKMLESFIRNIPDPNF